MASERKSAFSQKTQLTQILHMLSDGWDEDEVANIILNATKGKIKLDAYNGFNGAKLSQESKYTK